MSHKPLAPMVPPCFMKRGPKCDLRISCTPWYGLIELQGIAVFVVAQIAIAISNHDQCKQFFMNKY